MDCFVRVVCVESVHDILKGSVSALYRPYIISALYLNVAVEGAERLTVSLRSTWAEADPELAPGPNGMPNTYFSMAGSPPVL